MGNPFSIHDIEFGLFEGRSYLVLDNFDTGPVADDVVATLEALNTPYIHTNRRIELQGTATRRCFRISEHDTHFFTDLVDKDRRRTALGNDSRQFAQA